MVKNVVFDLVSRVKEHNFIIFIDTVDIYIFIVYEVLQMVKSL